MPALEDVAAALITAMNSALSSYGATPDAVKALDYDDAAKATGDHVQVGLARRYTGVERAGREAQKPYRLTTRPVAGFVGSARGLDKRVDSALNGARITVDGATSTPIRLETSDEIGPDDGKFSGLTTWTFVL